MAVEAEGYEAIKILITQKKDTERELEEIVNINWFIYSSALNGVWGEIKIYLHNRN